MDRRLGVIRAWSLFPGLAVHPKEIAWNRNAIAKKLSQFLTLLPLVGAIATQSAIAQPVTSDGSTNTIVTPDGNRLDITGGQLSNDGTNLFHSFSQFGLDANQIGNFISNPEILNILSRVTGGNPSVINGLLQVTGGNSNLFLINPAGIIFGSNAQLNVPASFTATTATGISFGNHWFSATGANDYAALVGTPSNFAFTTSMPGAILNDGELTVQPGQNLTLLGGTVVNTGKLTAPGGNINVAAVPGESLVRLSQPGSVLSLEVQPLSGAADSQPNAWTLPVVALPQLLTGGSDTNATELTTNSDGTVALSGSGIPIAAGDVVGGDVRAKAATLSANHNLTLVESQLQTTGDLQLLAQDTVQVRDSVSTPFLAQAGGNLYIQGKERIDILALNHPQTPFQSGGELSLVSNGDISGDAHFTSGSSFSILDLSGNPGSFVSLYDPIISSNGDVVFGNYTGAALKVEAIGSIRGGNITITQPDTSGAIPSTDEHFEILTTTPSLVLQAGKAALEYPANVPQLGIGTPPIDFTGDTTGLTPGSIEVDRVTTSSGTAGQNAGTVIMEATGDIQVARIVSDWNGATGTGDGGDISLTSGGDITISIPPLESIRSTSSNGNGGDISLIAGGDISLLDVLSTGNNGSGGDITITVGGNVNVDDIQTRGTLNGGEVQVTSGGTIDTTTANQDNATATGIIGSCSTTVINVCTGDGTGRGGNITLQAANSIATGSVDASGLAGGGDITLTSNEIDFVPVRTTPPVVRSSGALVLQPFTSGQDIEIGGTGDTGALNLSTTDLAALEDGFSLLTFGGSDNTGNITVNATTFFDPVTIQSATGAIAVNGAIIGLDNASITLQANQDITTEDITTNGSAITLISEAGSVETGNLNSSGVAEGGDITISALTQITTGIIDSSSTQGDAGDVTLDPENDIDVVSINAQGGVAGTGGNVDITSEQFFRASGTFTDQTNTTTSISTAGGITGGSVIIRHDGGATDTPFTVGADYNAINGTAGAIATGSDNQILFGVYPELYNQGVAPSDIQLITSAIDTPIDPNPIDPNPIDPNPIDPNPIDPNPVDPNPIDPNPIDPNPVDPNPIDPNPIDPNPVDPNPVPPDLPVDATILPQQNPVSQLSTDVSLPSVEIDPVLAPVDEAFTRQFEAHLGLPNNEIRTLPEAQEILQDIEKATGVKPALIYVTFVPPDTSLNAQPNRDNEELELLLVTSTGNAIRKRVGTKRPKVLNVADTFRESVTNVRDNRDYLYPSRQLYQWLIAPLEEDLQTQGIQNLVFIMDVGLRSVAVAALNDGKQFLVERYSVGLMPSLSLTDTRYKDIKDSQVLGMGVEEFPDKRPLPAVPLELNVITKQLWTGKSFLDGAFTLDNLKAQRKQEPFGIIHLATHANFLPGAASNSYIQLWNSKLRLDQLPQLGWNKPPVELLVLSACRSALGDEEAELGFAGLSVQAGVKSSLASLWYVSDEGTLGLMTNFYQKLKTAPIKAVALQQAQIAMLNGEVRVEDGQLYTPGGVLTLPPELAQTGNRPLTHPYYWAAFTLVGNPW
jgi:filamentous hemagglutinin family protein